MLDLRLPGGSLRGSERFSGSSLTSLRPCGFPYPQVFDHPAKKIDLKSNPNATVEGLDPLLPRLWHSILSKIPVPEFSKGKVVQLAHLLSPALSLRLARNAYAGKTSHSALLLAFRLPSTDQPLNSPTFTTQAALDVSDLTHDSIELTESIMIRIAAFDWYLPI